jgi:hypothetical protein
MTAHSADDALLLAKKFGGMLLIVLGILAIAIGLEYRSNGVSFALIVGGIIALGYGMALLALKIIRRNTA